jgi:hypothetical protein
MNPRLLLQLEGASALALSLFAYHWNQGSWVLFAVLFLVPDASMIGYLANVRLGAITYNAIHTYVGPILLAGYAIGGGHKQALMISLIWTAHIGLDRMLGFGLKYATGFKDTHLNTARHALHIGSAPRPKPA